VTLIDTNIILDVVTADPRWSSWSRFSLEVAARAGRLIINDIIYAELSTRYETMEALESLLAGMEIQIEAMPRAGLFLAAKVYQRYLARGGTRSGVLPDFFIGAHAAIGQCALLTRDPSRYRSYFPTLRLIVPA
jgi:predicted nucleic acid-binding protein